ncbi:substrate-binding periplasmic protein [Lacimicrobium alkaliphilum]|uniref:Solute-binding protein family 3/N-terminal domain-containing protein n=1 Tax=Lacimicrobium alkaliphilum TaxID=1526571 RepID=A0ABQ1RBU5_9ALTE|nr:transporter substrate-binding domain-containing protein [Lacimicrobium alkaliphilum]GGD65276.1 hypothetical protein GCM10011357_20720 [Lacimicrobium alkaliphilum]
MSFYKPGRVRFTLLSLVILLYQFRSPAIAEPVSLTIYTEHYPPYSYEHNGQLTGINLQLVRRLCEQARIDCKFELYPWLRAFDNALKDPRGGLVSTSRTQEREKRFKWVGPLIFDESYLYRLGSRSEVEPTNLDQAKQYIVAIPRGDVYEQYFLKHGFSYEKNLVAFSNKPDAFEMLIKGKVDLIMGSQVVIPYWLSHIDQPDLAVHPVLAVPDVGGNHLALNPGISDRVRDKLQHQLDILRSNGELEKLKKAYSDKLFLSGDQK